MSPCPQWEPSFFFFNDTATTEIYTLSLHDALPISFGVCIDIVLVWRTDLFPVVQNLQVPLADIEAVHRSARDRKSTRLNSSHLVISYAVFCLKKKKFLARFIDTDNGNPDVTSADNL